MHVRLTDDDGACVLQLCHLKRIVGWVPLRQRDRAGRGRQADHVVVVLHNHRDTVERTSGAGVGSLAVELFCFTERSVIERDHGVQRRSALVEGLDSRQVLLDQLAGRDTTGVHGALQLGNGLLQDIKRWLGRLIRRGTTRSGDDEPEQGGVGRVDAHPAAAKLRDDPVAAERRAVNECHTKERLYLCARAVAPHIESRGSGVPSTKYLGFRLT